MSAMREGDAHTSVNISTQIKGKFFTVETKKTKIQRAWNLQVFIQSSGYT
jgi:hypothetical protein